MGVQWGGRFELTVASSSITTVTVHCGTSVQYRTIGTVQVCYTFDALPMAQQGMIIVAVVLAFETEACVSWRQSWSWPTSGLITLITSQALASHSHPPVLHSLSQRVMLDCISGLHSLACSSLPPGIPEQPPRPKIKIGCQFGSAKATQLKYGALLVPRLKKSTFK